MVSINSAFASSAAAAGFSSSVNTTASTKSTSNSNDVPSSSSSSTSSSSSSKASASETQKFDFNQARDLADKVASGATDVSKLSDQEKQVVKAFQNFEADSEKARAEGKTTTDAFKELNSNLKDINAGESKLTLETKSETSSSTSAASSTSTKEEELQDFDLNKARELSDKVASGEVESDSLSDQEKAAVAAVKKFDEDVETARSEGKSTVSALKDLNASLEKVNSGDFEKTESSTEKKTLEVASENKKAAENKEFDYQQARDLASKVESGEIETDKLSDQEKAVVAAVKKFDEESATARAQGESSRAAFNELNNSLESISSGQNTASADAKNEPAANNETQVAAAKAEEKQSFDFQQARDLASKVESGELDADKLTDQEKEVVAAVNKFDKDSEAARANGGTSTAAFKELNASLNKISSEEPAKEAAADNQTVAKTDTADTDSKTEAPAQKFDFQQARDLATQVANGDKNADSLTEQEKEVVAAINAFDDASEKARANGGTSTSAFTELMSKLEGINSTGEESSSEAPSLATSNDSSQGTQTASRGEQPSVQDNRAAIISEFSHAKNSGVSFNLATAASLFGGESRGNLINERT